MILASEMKDLLRARDGDGRESLDQRVCRMQSCAPKSQVQIRKMANSSKYMGKLLD